MIFGENILSRFPADWSILNGSMTQAYMQLNAGGRATQNLTLADVTTIPERFLVSIIADQYTDSHIPQAFATIKVTTVDNAYEYNIPIINTGGGFCTIEVPMVATEYLSLSFTIRTDYAIIVSGWLLAGPVAVDVNVDEIKEEIPRLLADYNTSAFTVGQREEVIALISAHLLASTDVSGHLQVAYTAHQSCTITMRIKDNDGTELFAPLFYDVKSGAGSIGIPHAFLKRLAGSHTFTVTAQCSKGLISFYTRSILFTVDAGYMAQRTLDIDTNMQDIALRKLASESSPGYIYAIGIDRDGIIRVRRRLYNQPSAVVWEPLYQIGEGKAAAIEFNGVWQRIGSAELFSISCEEHPWIFWVDLEDVLWAQHGDNVATRIQLDTGVTLISAVRGYKSESFLTQDQGLILAYTKAGLAYYRNYVYQLNEATIWEEVRSLPELGTNVTSLQIHRLNDYRIGIIAKSDLGLKWLITDRTYVAAAVPREYVGLNAQVAPFVCSVIPEQYIYNVDPMFEINTAGTIITITFPYPFISAGQSLANTMSASVTIGSVANIAYNYNQMTITLKEPVNSTYLTIEADYRYFRYILPNGSWYLPATLIWTKLFPIKHGMTEQVAFDVNTTLAMAQLPLLTYERYHNETVELELSLSAMSIEQKALATTLSYHQETVSFNVATTLSLVPAFVGVIPI